MDFIELLDKYNVSYKQAGEHHHTTRGWIQLDCPQCSPNSGHYRLGYNLKYGYCSCWICARVELWYLVWCLTGLPKKQIYEICRGFPKEQFLESKTLKRTGKLKLPQGVGGLDEPHLDYLVNRGFKPVDVALKWGIQGIGQHGGFLKWRIFVPIHYKGEVVAWTTRTINEFKEPRYWSSAEHESIYNIHSLLYGIDHVRDSALVVEGCFDVWAYGPGSIATMGTLVTPHQIEQLSRIPRRFICFDNEPLAQVKARKLCADLSVFEGETTNVVLESGKDLASCHKDEIESLRELIHA